MAKGHRSQIKRERNAVKDTRPSAKLSYARMSVQKACFVLDAIRGKDVQTALGYCNVQSKIRFQRDREVIKICNRKRREQQRNEQQRTFTLQSVMQTKDRQ